MLRNVSAPWALGAAGSGAQTLLAEDLVSARALHPPPGSPRPRPASASLKRVVVLLKPSQEQTPWPRGTMRGRRRRMRRSSGRSTSGGQRGSSGTALKLGAVSERARVGARVFVHSGKDRGA